MAAVAACNNTIVETTTGAVISSGGISRRGNGGGGGTTTCSIIVSGYSSLTDAAFRPSPVQISVTDTVTWRNDDSQTITSGVNGQPDGRFDSRAMAPAVTAVIFKINYFWTNISYWYYLAIVLSFSSSSSLSSAGVDVLVTRCCSLLLFLQCDISLVYWRYILSHPIFLFMVYCRVADLAYCLSLWYYSCIAIIILRKAVWQQ